MTDIAATGQPVPQGLYRLAARHGDIIYTAGMTPRKNGVLQFKGVVAADAEPEEYREATVLACTNALAAARSMLMAGEELHVILNMNVYIAAEAGFVAHSALADFASAFLAAELGEQSLGCRAAIGVATLPGNAPVELQLVASARRVEG